MKAYGNIISETIEAGKKIAQQQGEIYKWSKWYKGNYPPFHNYEVYNGEEKVKQRKLSLGMAKRGAEDWASLLVNEKCDAVINSGQEYLESLLERLQFWNKANAGVELGFALSMSALVVDLSVDANEDGFIVQGRQSLSLYNATHIIPITLENGNITEVAFVTENTNEDIVSIHHKDANDNYVITIAKVIDKNGKTKEDPIEIVTNSKMPLFTIIHPNIVNNLDIESQYPISIFANAIDNLMAIDNKYDSFNNEFVLGRKRVYISSEAFHVDPLTGNVNRTVSPQDVLFYKLPNQTSATGESKPFVKTDVDQLRSADHISAINEELNIFSNKIGLGTDYYSFESGRVMTATQVISEKSDAFRNKRRHEILLEVCLRTIIKAIIETEKTYNANEKGVSEMDSSEIVIVFDDSIIEDKEAQKTSDRADVGSGVMSKVEYRMKWYNEDEKTAKAMTDKFFGDVSLANRINAFIPALTAGALTVTQFVELVYPNEADKEKLVAEITATMKSNASISQEDVLGAGCYKPTNKTETK
jgi:A118 family predicted phage portal protein